MLWLAYFTYNNYLQVHSCCHKSQDFLLFMAQKYPMVYVCYIFFVHSCADGHLVSFHLLAIVNNVTVYISIQIYLQYRFNFFWTYTPAMRLLHYILYLFFQETSLLFSLMAITNFKTHQQCARIPFSPDLLKILIFSLYDNSHYKMS
jgi:hypothetical protein